MRISDWSSDVCSSDLLFASARRIFQKALITRYIGRIQLGDFMAKGILVIAVIELRAVGPIKAVKGADWLQRDILRHFMAGQLPQLTQGARVRDDVRSGIKSEAVLFPDIGSAYGPVAPSDTRGCYTCGFESHDASRVWKEGCV